MHRLNPGRLAGLIYLVACAPAAFSYMYVEPSLVVFTDAAATARNILASETLFRLGIVAELISSIGFIFLVLSVYRLFRDIDRPMAITMVILVLVSIPVSMLNCVNLVTALRLFKGGASVAAIGTAQLQAMAMLFLRVHSAGVFIAQIFWGLWLLPLGMLVRRSGFVPPILGTLLIYNGLAYPIVTLIWLLAPSYAATATQVALLPQLGEAWFILWLLIKGVPATRATPQFAPAMACAILLITTTLSAGEVIRRGEAIKAGTPRVALATVLAKPNEFTTQPFVTEGVVEKVCRFAGCWMNVSPAHGQPGIHVTFKNGAFVVPRNSAGQNVRLLGKVRMTEKKPAFVASGVELR